MGVRNKNTITSFVFLVFLFGASIFSIIKPSGSFSEVENRYLAQKPEFAIKSVLDGTFGTQYEVYLSDQFPLRNQWIGMKTLVERGILKQDINGVYFGKDGYLIETFEGEQMEGEVLSKNKERIKTFVETYESMLGEGKVKVMLIPSASQVLTDKLPAFASPYNQKKIWFDLRNELGEQTVLAVDELLAIYREEPIFYRTDHHWTTLGAYYAYELWANSLGLTPWEQDEFLIDSVTNEFYGTVAAKVNISVKPDTIELYIPREPMNYSIIYDTNNASGELYNYNALKGRDNYSIFLDGNHALTEINTDLQNNRKLLIIKDSFANCFAPFAVNHFETTYLVDFRYLNSSINQLIKDKEITDILVLYQGVNFAKDVQLTKLNR